MLKTIQEGTKVSGKYLGDYEFTGTITDTRFAPYGCYYITIILDNEIEVYGDMRKSFSEYVKRFDGGFASTERMCGTIFD